ncbi:hypothetical protein GQ53DRAFT_772850 [Thozetella sp. PMI_491]|nr:hypothetical protein GQ53DRAFT_772850 [Thozetella sp. PMI_491]
MGTLTLLRAAHVIILASVALAASPTFTLLIPSSVPSNAPAPPADFVGFGTATFGLPQLANNFSKNLITSVAKRTSASSPPVIRIGGTEGDYLDIDLRSDAPIMRCEGKCPGNLGHWIFGTKFFESFGWFPAAKMTIQAPMGPKINMTRTVDFVRLAWESAGANRVDAIALGNEVSVYDNNGPMAYLKPAIRVEEKLRQVLNLTDAQSRIFEIADGLSGPSNSHDPYSVQELFEAGINNNSLSKYAAEHYYQTAGPVDTFAKLQSLLMNHTINIRAGLPGRVKSINYLRQNFPNVPYIISEWGDTLNGPINFTTCFGAALWVIDFDLLAMTRGVARVAHTQGPYTSHSLWVPAQQANGVNKGPPQVRPVFAATAFVADFIGNTTSPGHVAELSIGGNRSDFVGAYAIYENTQASTSPGPSRVALLNMKLWNLKGGADAARGHVTYVLPVTKSGTKTLQVRRFVTEAGAAAMGFDAGGVTENVTWAGEQWSKTVDNGKGHFTTGGETVETLNVADGYAEVEVRDTEAVMFILIPQCI